jgi:hypothetical protein
LSFGLWLGVMLLVGEVLERRERGSRSCTGRSRS